MDQYYTIEIFTEDNPPSLLNEIKNLTETKKPKAKDIEDEPVILMNVKPKERKETKKPKKKKKSLLLGAFDTDENDPEYDLEEHESTLLDVDNILLNIEEEDQDNSIIKEQKKGYKKLKKGENEYKKEFAEELTLLYSLLDETSKFSKDLEKELSSLKGNKVRGVSKYTNDLAELVLTSKQNKLNILKEITAVKKTVADLKIKAEGKAGKDKESNGNNPEQLAAAYFKNVLTHGRSNFINAIGGAGNDAPPAYSDEIEDERDAFIDKIEMLRGNNTDDDSDKYSQFMMDRLNNSDNPYRSAEGSKYIEYENLGVKLYVKKCIDTGEWEFIAVDKNGRQIYDYPLPSKRDAGRMRFSDDGQYATDAKGRIYTVKEYYLPEYE